MSLWTALKHGGARMKAGCSHVPVLFMVVAGDTVPSVAVRWQHKRKRGGGLLSRWQRAEESVELGLQTQTGVGEERNVGLGRRVCWD